MTQLGIRYLSIVSCTYLFPGDWVFTQNQVSQFGTAAQTLHIAELSNIVVAQDQRGQVW